MATITGYIYYFTKGDTLHVPSGYLDIVSCDISGDSNTVTCRHENVSVCVCVHVLSYVRTQACISVHRYQCACLSECIMFVCACGCVCDRACVYVCTRV